MDTTAYPLRDWAYCFVFILHVHLSTYCVIASAPSFLRCSSLKSQSFWIFCDSCTIQNVLLSQSAFSVKCFNCIVIIVIYSFTLLPFWCHLLSFLYSMKHKKRFYRLNVWAVHFHVMTVDVFLSLTESSPYDTCVISNVLKLYFSFAQD